jgi:hypothetical protein
MMLAFQVREIIDKRKMVNMMEIVHKLLIDQDIRIKELENHLKKNI